FQWYYDKELDECFEYLYEGCGGGRNTFYTKDTCRTACIPADKGRCGGNMKPTGSCSAFDKNCPTGSTCEVGPMGGGMCCDDKNEELWKQERNPKCKSGSLSMRTVWWGSEPRIGRSCSHEYVDSSCTEFALILSERLQMRAVEAFSALL
ncbi:Kunitz/Bovine pancreatic trypsin inhibitor domain protein, partial [Necator americanus]